jgi:cysteine desulfurase / selenocysteine lyase
MNRIPSPRFDLDRAIQDFPILDQNIHGQRLVYLDNAASTQKPNAVIDAISGFYRSDYANVHRGVHTLSQRATDRFEGAREKIQEFIGAAHNHEVIFVRGATEGINLVAQSFVRPRLSTGDEILITAMEHHANIVPWQMIAEATGAILRVAPMSPEGELLMEEYLNLLCERTRMVAITHMSNALGTINPVKAMIAAAHAQAIPVLVDGAQAAPHLKIDVKELDCDFYVVSAHKLYGPSGIGILYGKEDLLNAMPPYQGGGDMIRQVTFEKSTYNDLPYKFEAGTPAIAEAVGFGAAIDYVNGIGLDAIAAHEHALLSFATEEALKIPGLRIIGTAREKGGILSFTLDRIHPHDIGTLLDHLGIAIRAGHHCAMPVMDFFHVPATARASFALYNTEEDIDTLMNGIREVIRMFG